MNEPTVHHNAPIKTCQNCAYRSGEGSAAKCLRSGFSCDVERQFSGYDSAQCNAAFHGWRALPPKPQRRSLRAWFCDTFLA